MNNMTRHWGITAGWMLVFAGLLAIAVVATARPGASDRDGKGHHKKRMKGAYMMMKSHIRRLDADNNGQISEAEYTAHSVEIFAMTDRNADGKLTTAEFDSVGKVKRQLAVLRHLDANGDGNISEQEFATGKKRGKGHGKGRKKGRGMHGKGGMMPLMMRSAMAGGKGKGHGQKAKAAIFAGLDKDGNGQLSLQELSGMRKARLAWHFNHLDSNQNGSLSMTEFQAPQEEAFALMDANSDGSLNRQEMMRAMKKAFAMKKHAKKGRNEHRKQGKHRRDHR